RASLVDGEVIPKLKVPLPVTAEVTSTVYHVLRATEPSVPSVAPSMVGWLFQVTAVSDQVVLVIPATEPPLELPAPLTSRTGIRSVALVTGSVKPLTVKLMNVLRTGELSTTTSTAVPKFVAGDPLSTYVSATGVNVVVAAAAGGATATTAVVSRLAAAAAVTAALVPRVIMR